MREALINYKPFAYRTNIQHSYKLVTGSYQSVPIDIRDPRGYWLRQRLEDIPVERTLTEYAIPALSEDDLEPEWD